MHNIKLKIIIKLVVVASSAKAGDEISIYLQDWRGRARNE